MTHHRADRRSRASRPMRRRRRTSSDERTGRLVRAHHDPRRRAPLADPDRRRADHVVPTRGARRHAPAGGRCFAHPFRAGGVDARELPARRSTPADSGTPSSTASRSRCRRRSSRSRSPRSPRTPSRGWSSAAGTCMFVHRRRPAGRAAADGADPDPAAVHRRRGDRQAAASSPTST